MSKDKQTQVWAECGVMGHLRSGHISMHLNDEELKEFKALSQEEKEQYLNDNGEFELSDYRIDWKEIQDIHIEEK